MPPAPDPSVTGPFECAPGASPCACSPPVPAYASRRNRQPRLVHIATWDANDQGHPRALCGSGVHRSLAPSPYAAITCPLCLRLWDRGYRRRATLLRHYPVRGKPGQFYTVPDVPPVAVNA